MRKPPASETGAVDARDMRKPPASETGAVAARDMRKPPLSETVCANHHGHVMTTQFMVAVLGSSSSACKSTAAHGQQLYGSLYQNCSTCLASLHAHRVHQMAAMSSQAPMNKMLEKLMDKPAQHRWLACQCIMLDKSIVVKTSSSFGHLPQQRDWCGGRS